VPQLIDLFLVAGERSAEYVLRKYHLNEEQRLSITFDYLDYHGYLPSIERTHRDLHILVNNCPYLEALKLTPELCHYDKGLIQTLMGSQGSMRSLVTSSEPCIFRFASIS
jgi:predicted ArsR family transcriptional regulator